MYPIIFFSFPMHPSIITDVYGRRKWTRQAKKTIFLLLYADGGFYNVGNSISEVYV